MLLRFRLLFFCLRWSGRSRRSGLLRFFKLMRVIGLLRRPGRRRKFHGGVLLLDGGIVHLARLRTRLRLLLRLLAELWLLLHGLLLELWLLLWMLLHLRLWRLLVKLWLLLRRLLLLQLLWRTLLKLRLRRLLLQRFHLLLRLLSRRAALAVRLNELRAGI